LQKSNELKKWKYQMKKISLYSLVIIFALIIGCAGQLAIKEIWVEPGEAIPGIEAKVFVVLKGSTDKVSKIIATVREAPDMNFPLNDKGKDGDEKAGDNTWSYQVIVPWDADAGIYHLDISVYDKAGKDIVSKGMEQRRTGRSGSVEVIVK